MQDASPACIGNATAKAFRGVFDGNGHTILNLAPVAAEAGSSGLFGYLDGATVKDLTVEGYTNSGKANGQGVIAGTAKNATITNCHVNARVHFMRHGRHRRPDGRRPGGGLLRRGLHPE